MNLTPGLPRDRRAIDSWFERFTPQHCGEMVTERATRRPTRFPTVQSQERTFLARRAAAVERLVLAGIGRRHAEAWIAAWVNSTAGLTDFRAAADYWDLGFQYAIEERRRGYHPPDTID